MSRGPATGTDRRDVRGLLEDVGITGYPTGHESIDDVRHRGIDLPVEVGIPGVMNYLKLLQLSWQWGVADPIRFVRKTMGIAGFFRKLLVSGGQYEPDDMVAELAPYHDDDLYDFRRTRLYTFNQTAETESWRRARLGE
jgi:methylenetetrahydrofolate reductase (NADPH)